LNGLSLYDAFLVGKKKFRQDTIFYLIENTLLTVALIATILITTRAIVLVLVYFLVSTIVTAFFYRASLAQAKNNTEDPSLFKYSAHMSVINIVGAIADKIDSIAVFTFLGPAELAVYAYAIAIPEQVKGMLKNLLPIAMPKFAKRSMKEIKETLWKRIFVLGLMLTTGVLVYIAVVPYLFAIFFPIYMESVPYSRLYALSLIFIACTAPIVAVLQSHKKTRELYIMTNFSSGLLVVALPILTFKYGIWGALISQFVYRGVRMGLAAWQFIRIKE
jgi:O-antigen/teichoic acid export membrane protein